MLRVVSREQLENAQHQKARAIQLPRSIVHSLTILRFVLVCNAKEHWMFISLTTMRLGPPSKISRRNSGASVCTYWAMAEIGRWLVLLLITTTIGPGCPAYLIGQTQQTLAPDQQTKEAPAQTVKQKSHQDSSKESPQRQIELELIRIGKKYKHPSLFAGYQTLGGPFIGAARGRRKKGSDVRVTIDDKVHIGSCTKAMTATLIAKLIERGVLKNGTLAWDMTIAEGLPELSKMIDPIFAKVTLRQLLTHRGGCPANTNWSAAKRKKSIVETRRSVIRIALKKERDNKPGDFLYSNVGYVVAAAMAERATGESWETLMREEIFEPLNLKSAGFGPPDVDQDIKQPWGHSSMATLQIPTHFDNPAALGPAGTVHMSLGDWAKFCLVHAVKAQANGKNEDQSEKTTAPKLVSQASLDFLHTPPENAQGAGDDYALGWKVLEREWGGTVFAHSGSNTLWTAIVWVSPENKSVYLAATNIANEQAGIGLDKIFATLIRLEKETRK